MVVGLILTNCQQDHKSYTNSLHLPWLFLFIYDVRSFNNAKFYDCEGGNVNKSGGHATDQVVYSAVTTSAQPYHQHVLAEERW